MNYIDCLTSFCCSGNFMLSKIRNTIRKRSRHQWASNVSPYVFMISNITVRPLLAKMQNIDLINKRQVTQNDRRKRLTFKMSDFIFLHNGFKSVSESYLLFSRCTLFLKNKTHKSVVNIRLIAFKVRKKHKLHLPCSNI